MSLQHERPRSTSTRRATWLGRARPLDYALSVADSYAELPYVGRYFEPLGGMVALGFWGYRHAPAFAANAVRTRLTRRRAVDEKDVLWTAPALRAASQRRKYLYRRSVRYGANAAQVLDIWRKKNTDCTDAPVLVFVPGGAWVNCSRFLQGHALMAHLAERGWICLSVGYRCSPHHRWPRHIVDVNSALAWARNNVEAFGGDKHFVTIAGTSAGGHLAALAALAPGDYSLSTKRRKNESVQAAVGIYGRYDWEDRTTPERESFVQFLERIVVGKRQREQPDVFRLASPINRVNPAAPPFLVVHGDADSVIPVAQARAFADRLRETSASDVSYLELPGAGHGFDMTNGRQTDVAIAAIASYLDRCHRDYLSPTHTVVM